MAGNKDENLIPFDRTESDDDRSLTLTYHRREVHLYQVTEEELQNLERAGEYKTIDVTLFGICVTGFLSLLITLLTIDIENKYTFSAFVSVCAIFFLGALFTGSRMRMATKNVEKIMKKITGK